MIYLILVLTFLFTLAIIFASRLIIFKNKVVNKKENIDKAKSSIRIIKAKYLQVLRKVGTTQKEVTEAQGNAYGIANLNGAGAFIGGAIGEIDSNFEAAGELVISLAKEYESAQQKLNTLVNEYNVYITLFPQSILAKIFKCKKEEYIDSDNLDLSTRLNGFDETDI